MSDSKPFLSTNLDMYEESSDGKRHCSKSKTEKLKYLCFFLLGCVFVVAIGTSVISALYCNGMRFEVQKEKIEVQKIHEDVLEIWNKIRDHQSMPLMLHLQNSVDSESNDTENVYDSDAEEDETEIDEDSDVESSGDYDYSLEDFDDTEESVDTEESDEDDDYSTGTDKEDKTERGEEKGDSSEDISPRSKRSAGKTNDAKKAIRTCIKACKEQPKNKRRECRDKCKAGTNDKKKNDLKHSSTNLKSAHFSTIVTKDYFIDSFDERRMLAKCKQIPVLDGELCRNKTFTPNGNSLKIFKTDNISQERAPVQLDDGYKAIVKENEAGVYFVYAQAILPGGGSAKTLSLLKNNIVVASCQNGVHPDHMSSQSTLDQSCFVQRLVYLKAKDFVTIRVGPKGEAVEASLGTFFGMFKISDK